MPSMLDLIVGSLRPLQVRGKGRLLDRFTPHSGVRTVRVWEGVDMTLNLSNAIHRMIYMGAFSPHITAHLRSLLPPGGTFLDVGANVGYFSLLASRLVGPSGRVLAVEPNPGAFGALAASVESNRIAHVDARMIALSGAEGTLRLYSPPGGDRDYNVTMVEAPGWTPIDVPCRRLDDLLAESGVERVDLMKMDVEGAEPLVLEGGASSLAGGVVRHLITEVNGPRLAGTGSSPARLVEQLDRLGFAPARLQAGRAVPVSASSWDLDPSHEHDRLFVHRSTR